MRSAIGWMCLPYLVLLGACSRPPTPDQLEWFRSAAEAIDASAIRCARDLREVTRPYPETACRALDVEPSPWNRWKAHDIAENEIARQLAMVQAGEQPLRDAEKADGTTVARVSAGVARAHWVAERLCRARDVAETLARRESRRATPAELAKRAQ